MADPEPDYYNKEPDKDFLFSFKNYKSQILSSSTSNHEETISFNENDLTELEKYVLFNFYPVIKLIDTPDVIKKVEDDENNKVFKINSYPSLYCQSSKSLLYYFDSSESSLVIDKLKKELDERTSEFRDFPEEDANEESFEDSAYYLDYDGTDGKIRTLKDYKENRYGLTVYLANKIFSCLRHEKNISDKEAEIILKFFRGTNCINFYRLWERIFTFFLVNKTPRPYVDFYVHCVKQIEKIIIENKNIKVSNDAIRETLISYLDTAHELALSLNPKFIQQTREVWTHFKFEMKRVEGLLPTFFSLKFEPTKPDSFWVRRFRETNMMRQHYVIHPLLSYTIKSKTEGIDLTALKLNIKEYILDPDLLDNSPRRVKFSECCLSVALTDLADFNLKESTIDNNEVKTGVIGVIQKITKNRGKVQESTAFYLDNAFDLYKQLNRTHIPDYKFDDEAFKKTFFSRHEKFASYNGTGPIAVQELHINTSRNKLAKPLISFANTEVKEINIIDGMRGTPNLSKERYKELAEILKNSRKEKSDLLLFPEFFIPINLLSSMVLYAERNQVLTLTGLEHVLIENTAFNFIVTIIPFEKDGIRDAVVNFRLKNHYAHVEEALIHGNHSNIPKPFVYRYDIINWRNLYFAPFYCFELANVFHRSLMKGKIDLLIGVEWNKDTNYFSNIVEAGSRDLHTYVAQVNTSQYGDSRLTQPVETARKDILRLKGGRNDTILVERIDITALREFQRQKYSLTHTAGTFKPLPPDFKYVDVLKRINNQNVL